MTDISVPTTWTLVPSDDWAMTPGIKCPRSMFHATDTVYLWSDSTGVSLSPTLGDGWMIPNPFPGGNLMIALAPDAPTLQPFFHSPVRCVLADHQFKPYGRSPQIWVLDWGEAVLLPNGQIFWRPAAPTGRIKLWAISTLEHYYERFLINWKRRNGNDYNERAAAEARERGHERLAVMLASREVGEPEES